MNSYFKTVILLLSCYFISCKEDIRPDSKKQLSDFDVFFSNFPKTDYVEIQRINLNSDQSQDFYIWEKGQNRNTITFFDGKTKMKIGKDSIKGSVTSDFSPSIYIKNTSPNVAITISEIEIETVKILQYNPNKKIMATIFEYPFITRIGNKILNINYIDIFDNSKEHDEKITIYEGKLIDKDYTNIENIKPKNKKVLKTFLYNREKMIFEEQKQ